MYSLGLRCVQCYCNLIRTNLKPPPHLCELCYDFDLRVYHGIRYFIMEKVVYENKLFFY